MELRVLKYFLAVAYEESISGAAENVLHVTQPTLSRQMMELEEELGVKLFVRSNRKTLLTEDGMRLRKRAEEIMELVDKTTSEFVKDEKEISGRICIGGGESDSMRLIAQTAKTVHEKYPLITFSTFSGNAQGVTEKLDQGLLDFGILIEPVDKHKYEFMPLPVTDTWGVIMKKDSPLASKEFIEPEDLKNIPLIVSSQFETKKEFSSWLKDDFAKLNIVANYNLVFNATLMMDAGLGYLLALDKLVYRNDQTEFKFVPLKPRMEVGLVVVWKKYSLFTKAAQVFMDELEKTVSEYKNKGGGR